MRTLGDVPSVTPEGGDAETRPLSQTLARGLSLLELLSYSPEPMTLAEIAAATGLHRSVVYRLLRTLQDRHFVSHTHYGYVLGTGAHSLGRRTSPVLQRIAKPEIARLAAAVGLTAFFVVRDSEEAVTLVSVEVQSSRSRVAYTPGDRHPLTLGSPGLAILSRDPARPGERPEIAVARRDGYASTTGEVLAKLSSLAAPVTLSTGIAVGAVAIAYTVEKPGPAQIREVLDSARIISGRVRKAEAAGVLIHSSL